MVSGSERASTLSLPRALLETVRPCGSDDRTAILALCAQTFGRPDAEQLAHRWEWLERNPHRRDAEALFWGLWLGGGLAGVLGRMPLVLSVGEEEVPGAWSSLLMVRPELQNRGIGGVLLEHFRRTSPVALLMGLSPSVYRLGLALGFREVAPVRYLFRPLGLRGALGPWLVLLGRGRLARRIPRLPFPGGPPSDLPGVQIQEVAGFDGTATALWRGAVQAGRVGVRRDAAYLNWKYRDHPYGRYRLLVAGTGMRVQGLAVGRTIEAGPLRIGTIAELACEPGAEHALRTLLGHLLAGFRRAGADLVKTLALDPSVRGALRGAGFFPLRRLPGFLLSASQRLAERIGSPGWILTYGDADLDQSAPMRDRDR